MSALCTQGGVGSALTSPQLLPMAPLGGTNVWVHEGNRDSVLPSCLRRRAQIELPIVSEEL